GGGPPEGRRNVLVAGGAVDDLVGSMLILDSGAGRVWLRVTRRANPCAWMDVTVGPGAWRALRGKGGTRCTPLTDGVLRVGPVSVEVLPGSAEPDLQEPGLFPASGAGN